MKSKHNIFALVGKANKEHKKQATKILFVNFFLQIEFVNSLKIQIHITKSNNLIGLKKNSSNLRTTQTYSILLNIENNDLFLPFAFIH